MASEEVKAQGIRASCQSHQPLSPARTIELGQVLLAKVDTDDMPADFLTKFVPTAKLERSIRRATNAGAAVPPART